jgi:hypothetical protein
MEPPVGIDIDLLSRVSVPLFAHGARREMWMTACLVGPDTALTTTALVGPDTPQIGLQIDGTSHEAQIELVDEVAGFVLVRFEPPITSELPRVFSMGERTVEREAKFLTLANLGHDRALAPLSGVVLGAVTRNGRRFYLAEVRSANDHMEGITGAPVVVEGQVLGLITGGALPGRSASAPTYLVVPFAAARGTPLAEHVAARGIAAPPAASMWPGGYSAESPEPAEPAEPAESAEFAESAESAEPGDARLYEMLSSQSRLALARAEAMRRAMRVERVHIEQLVVAMQQHPTGLAAAVLSSVGIDGPRLRDLVASVTGTALPAAGTPDRISALPPLSEHAREAVIAASRTSTDGTIHLSDLFTGAMSITDSAFIRALTELGVRIPPSWAARTSTQAAPPDAAPPPRPGYPPARNASPEVAPVPPPEVAPVPPPEVAPVPPPHEAPPPLQSEAPVPAHEAPPAPQAPDPRVAAGAAGPSQAAAASAIAAALAGFRSDGVSSQDDLLDIEHDVAALCSVIAARDVEPPLSIGLFGDWGSGKSFFLDAMREQLKRIEKAADAAEQDAIANGKPAKDATRYCARITQLEFNAWHYIDTELWASLANGIIDGLAKALERPTLDKVSATERARLLAAAAHSRDVIAEAEAERRLAESNLRDQEQVLQQALARAQAPQRGAAAVTQEARVLAIAASPVLQAELAKVTRQLGARAATAEARAALLDLQGLGATTRAVGRAIRASSRAAVIGVAVLAGLALGIATLRDRIDASVHVVVGAAVTIMTWFTSFRPYVKRARNAVGAIQQIVAQHGKALEAARQEATAQEQRKREQAATAVEAAKSRLTEARRDLEQIELQLIALRADQQMASFLKERQASDDYRKHLGVIARARSDFERLSDLLFRTRDDAPKQGLPRIDRIVLYIDDLDRCDEEQVVKVLQAVHLLLAFKLFVVVVAVDSRWLLHSLQQHSRAFQTDLGPDDGLSEDERLHWQSTPLNYLEKIFQIPFTLRPMGSIGFGNMIEHLTAERADAGTAAATPRMTAPGAATAVTTDATAAPSGAAAPGAPETSTARAGAPNAAVSNAAAPISDAAHPAPRAAAAAASPAMAVNAAAPFRDAGRAAPLAEPAADAAAATRAAGTGAAAQATPGSPPPITATTDGTAVHAAAPARPAAARPRLADTPVNVVPPHLVIEPSEQAFMKQFHELIATPRAVKRFVNVYRLLKARVPADRAAAFRRDDAGGEHRAAIFLLALLIGYPSEATDLMRDLTEKPALEDWWSWLFGYLSGEKKRATVKSPQQERLFELAAKLTAIRQRFAAPEPGQPELGLPGTEAFRFWTPYVARFSFQAGRLSAAVAPPETAPPADKPALRKPRTAAGSGKPRDRSEAR